MEKVSRFTPLELARLVGLERGFIGVASHKTYIDCNVTEITSGENKRFPLETYNGLLEDVQLITDIAKDIHGYDYQIFGRKQNTDVSIEYLYGQLRKYKKKKNKHLIILNPEMFIGFKASSDGNKIHSIAKGIAKNNAVIMFSNGKPQLGLDTCYKEEYDRLGLLNHHGYYWSKE